MSTLRRLQRTSRTVALYRRRRDTVGDGEDHPQIVLTNIISPIDTALTPQPDHQPADPRGCSTTSLGDVVFALEGRSAAAFRSATRALREHPALTGRPAKAPLQRPTLSLPGIRPLRSRCRDSAAASPTQRDRGAYHGAGSCMATAWYIDAGLTLSPTSFYDIDTPLRQLWSRTTTSMRHCAHSCGDELTA
jgi:hypothetical protein